MSLVIRPIIERDTRAVLDIYAHDVRTNTASWEYEPPSVDDFRTRIELIVRSGFPYLVAERDGMIVGFAYAGAFRTREAYRYTCEDSIYIHHEHRGAGVGGALLDALMKDCAENGCTTMIAVIGAADPSGSIALHTSRGFREQGRLPAIGYKFNVWLDLIFMVAELTPPGASRNLA